MFNKVILCGRLASDPVVRSTGSGNRVANFRLVTSEYHRDRETNERNDRIEGHFVVVFGPPVSFIENYTSTGTELIVEGMLKTRSYVKDGVRHYKTEVVVDGHGGSVRPSTAHGKRSSKNGISESGFNSGTELPIDRKFAEDFG